MNRTDLDWFVAIHSDYVAAAIRRFRETGDPTYHVIPVEHDRPASDMATMSDAALLEAHVEIVLQRTGQGGYIIAPANEDSERKVAEWARRNPRSMTPA